MPSFVLLSGCWQAWSWGPPEVLVFLLSLWYNYIEISCPPFLSHRNLVKG